MKKDYPILKSNIFDIVAISLLGILIYSNSFSGPFIFDGIPYIKENIALRNLSDIKAIWDFWPTRFVAFFTFALNQYFNKLTVFGYHLVNFLIHLGSSVLVCYLARLIFKTPQIKDRKIAEDSKLICLFSALIFLTHPLQTQAVTYIYQRSTCLATFFYLASICLYLRSRLSKKTISIHYILSLFVALVGMFTKEILFTLPLMIILFEFSLFKTHKKISFKFIGPFLLHFFCYTYCLGNYKNCIF